MFIDGFNTQMISYMVPRIAAEWGLSRALFGPIFSAALAGLVVGYLALSPLSDRFGHKRVVVLSTAAFAMISLASVWTRHVSDLMALRFLTGVGLGAATPSAVALTGEHSPQHLRATLVLAIYCGFSLGFVAAGVAASSLMIAYGWRSMFWAGGLAPLLLVPALVRYLPAPQPTSVGVKATRKNVRASVAQLFDRHTAPGTLLLWLVFVINLGEFYAFQSWLPTILTDRAYPPQTIVTATSLMTVGGIAVALIVGPAMDRIGPYVTLGLLYVLGFPFVALLGPALNGPAWVLFVATFLSGFCVSGGQKSAIALAALFYPANVRSTGVGWALGIGRLGGLAGPLLLGGALTRGVTPGEAFLAMSVLLLVTAAAVYIMGRQYVRTVEHAGQSERAVVLEGRTLC
jgi:AAHS family 4-hydroxybenzoate transporter-like MFS transporter